MPVPSIKNGGAAFTSNTEVPQSGGFTLTKPTGASAPANGDLLLIIVGNDDNTTTAQWDNSTLKPTGFTLINEAGNSSSDAHAAAFYRIADGTEGATVDVSTQSNDDVWGYYIVLVDVDQTTPLNVTGVDYNGSSATTHAPAQVTTTAANCLAFSIISGDGGDLEPITVTGTGWTEVSEIEAGNGTGNCVGCFATKDMAVAGVTGTATFDWTGSASDGGSGFQFAIAGTIGPTITTVGVDDEVDDGETSVAVVGTTYEAVQGTGKVEISNNADYATGTKIAQTVTAWSATSITITVVMGANGPGDHYLWVTNDTGQRNSTGFPVHVFRKQAFGMSLSGSFAPGGTTAQLTAPSAKTTGDMDGGRIEEALNPSATNTDVTADDYREDEWCFEATADAREVQYAFRVLYGGNVPDTLTVTPKLTISGGITLTTVSGTSAVGSVDKGISKAATGTAAVGSVGTVGNSVSVALTGTEATTAPGSLGVEKSGSAVLTGVEATGQAGSVGFTESGNAGITGTEVTSAVGNLAVGERAFPVTGVESTSGIGSVVPAAELTLSGEEATSAAGSVANATTLALSGVEGTSEVGSIGASSAGNQALTGVERAAQSGIVLPSHTVSLSGVQSSSAVGNVSADTSVQAALTGIEASSSVGSVAPSTENALSGIQSNADAGSLSIGTDTALSGAQANSGAGSIIPDTSIDLVGVQATSAVGTVAVGSDITLPLTGVEATSAVGSVSIPGAIAAQNARGFMNNINRFMSP